MDEDEQKWLEGVENGTNSWENYLAVPQKVKQEDTKWPNNLSLTCTPKWNENVSLQNFVCEYLEHHSS